MTVPVSLGKQVTTRTINWRQMVIADWGDQWAARSIVYDFAGEKKQSTDSTNRGFYSGQGGGGGGG
jgi:hypothetical protein